MNLTEYFQRSNKLVDDFPLTAFQAETIFLDQDLIVLPTSLAFQPCFRVEIGWIVSDIDVARLRQAAIAVVQRHQVLRTFFVDDPECPRQRSTPSVDDTHFFRKFEPAKTLSLAIELAQAFVADISINGPSPFRVVIIPSENRYCLLVAVHHFFADMDGLRVVVRDLWRAYSGEKFDTSPSIAYEQWCRNYAKRFDHPEWLDAHLTYWAHVNRPLTPLEVEATVQGASLPARFDMQSFTLERGGAELIDHAHRHRVLPIAVLLTALTEAFSSWFPNNLDATFLLTIAGSRLDQHLSDEVQCTVMNRPVTIQYSALHNASRIERCKAATKNILQMLRHAPLSPLVLPEGGASQHGGVVLNVLSQIEDPSDIASHLPQMTMIPRHAPHQDFEENDFNTTFEPDTRGLSVQIIIRNPGITIILSRFSRAPGATEMLAEHFERTLQEILHEES